MHTDDNWNPHMNQMGSAVVYQNGVGDWISGISMSAGPDNAFIAKLKAVKLGLKHALELNIKRVECSCD